MIEGEFLLWGVVYCPNCSQSQASKTILRHAPMVIGDLKLVIEDLELGIEDGGF